MAAELGFAGLLIVALAIERPVGRGCVTGRLRPKPEMAGRYALCVDRSFGHYRPIAQCAGKGTESRG